MQLGVRWLQDVQNVNSFRYTTNPSWTESDLQVVYFQLVDSNLDTVMEGFKPAGRRYCPPAGTTLSVVLESLDDAKKVTKTATQPYAQDPSIWTITVGTADKIRGTVTARLTLTQPGGVVYNAVLAGALRVRSVTV